ncbi:MAG TPA: ABC transporter permease [Bryobacteraceae bacterium]|nr:ABC transporter permease [Bryobacteraceae bacterium]
MPVWRDLQLGARSLRKTPFFTAAAVLTLALCIAANTALFSVVDAVLLRSLPYPAPERLLEIVTHYRAKGAEGDQHAQSGPTWFLVHDQATALDTAAFSDSASGVNLSTGNQARYVLQQRVSSGFFRVLGVPPLRGREFLASEDTTGGPAVAVLSYRLWQRLFNGDPSVVGRSIQLRGETYGVVGVMPAAFQADVQADLWTPLRPARTGEGEGENYAIVGRLRPGYTLAQANAQVAAAGAIALQPSQSADYSSALTLASLQRGLTNDLRQPLLVLWGAVAAVLLIGCVNIATLMIVRSAGRTHDIAVRMALGSGRFAVIRQLMAESFLLALGGGLAGLTLGYAVIEAAKKWAEETLHLRQAIALDARVLLAMLGLALFTSLLFGLAPAIQTTRTDLRALIVAGGRGVVGASHRWFRQSLVVLEVALSFVLLIGAGLLLRTFVAQSSLRPGFDSTHVITAQFSLQDASYRHVEQVNRLFEQTLSQIRASRSVEAAAVVLGLPYERPLNVNFLLMSGPDAGKEHMLTSLAYATPGYFQALRIPLRRGRLLRDSDGPNTERVVVVNDAFAKKYFQDREALGSYISVGGSARQIVGVIGDVPQQAGWGGNGPIAEEPAAFVSPMQVNDRFVQMVHTWFSPSWVVRATGSRAGLIAQIQKAVAQADPQLPIASFRSMDEVRALALGRQRFQAVLLSTLAGLALVLASIGLYGLIAHSVAERQRELGIRLAMGATIAQIMRQAALPGIGLSGIGIAIGGLLASLSVKALQHLVFGIATTDAGTFVAAAFVLALVATVASVIPALRVLKLNPSQMLRVS